MNNRILWVAVSIAALFATTLVAQERNPGSIRGSVIDDSTEHPLEFVNVILRMKDDTGIVAGKVTDRSGRFEFTEVATGNYFMMFSLIGYKEKKSPLFVIDAQHRHLNLGEVRLEATELSLEEVLVSGERPLFNASIDRKVYNVDQDLTIKAASASELLQNVPSVQVDIDGNVSLRGSSNVLIMLNGRTSPLMNKNSATVLEQMPASSIRKITPCASSSVPPNRLKRRITTTTMSTRCPQPRPDTTTR